MILKDCVVFPGCFLLIGQFFKRCPIPVEVFDPTRNIQGDLRCFVV